MEEENLFRLQRYGIWVLLFGIILLLIAPIIFTLKGCVSFTDTGQIGDTIGGVTAPITGLIGSILVYLALTAQVKANAIFFKQVKEEEKNKEFNNLLKIYELIANELSTFRNMRQSIDTTFVGVDGLRTLIDFLREDYTHNWPRAVEFAGIMKFSTEYYERITSSKLSEADKNTLMFLIKSLMYNKVFTFIIDSTNSRRTQILNSITTEKQQGHTVYVVYLNHYLALYDNASKLKSLLDK